MGPLLIDLANEQEANGKQPLRIRKKWKADYNGIEATAAHKRGHTDQAGHSGAQEEEVRQGRRVYDIMGTRTTVAGPFLMIEMDENAMLGPVDTEDYLTVWEDLDISERDLWDTMADHWVESQPEEDSVEKTDTATDTALPAQPVLLLSTGAKEVTQKSDPTTTCTESSR